MRQVKIKGFENWRLFRKTCDYLLHGDTCSQLKDDCCFRDCPEAEGIEPDNIKNPAHYTEDRQFETWNVIADWKLDYFLGNAVKYISRIGRKSDDIEDAKKAIAYLNKWIELNQLEAGE